MSTPNGKLTKVLISALVVVIVGFCTFIFGVIERKSDAQAEMIIDRIGSCDTKNVAQDEVIQEVLECQAETRTDIKYIREDISEIKELLKD